MSSFSVNAGIAFLCDAGSKGLILLAAAETALWFWKGASAATRHTVRVAAMLSLFLLPWVAWWTPAAPKPLWAIGSEQTSGNQIRLTFTFAPVPAPPHRAEAGSPLHAEVSGGSARAYHVEVKQSWLRLVLWVWMSGFLISGFPVLLGFFARLRLAQGCRNVGDGDWRELFEKACGKIPLYRRVRLLETDELTVPVTWGCFYPAIVVPSGSGQWSEERKRFVLEHELAHVRRWDCLTQLLAQAACAFHWFNPLVWRCAKALRLNREQACDDAVLVSGGKASDYAANLVQIASMLRADRRFGGIAMARPSQLEERINALVASARSRVVPGKALRVAIAVSAVVGIAAVAAQKLELPEAGRGSAGPLRARQLETLRRFSIRKAGQATNLVAQGKELFNPEFQQFFAAATQGDWQTVTNMYADFHRRHSQYSSGGGGGLPHTPYWQTVLEVCLAYRDVTWGEPEHVQLAIDGFMSSIPDGAVYFGGTDPGRGLPTAYSKSHAEADPFFTLTQNALADSTYLEYLREMYGSKLQLPSDEDSTTAFGQYVQDATARLKAGKLKPGENVKIDENGQTSVSGQVAVMEINARLAKLIFDRNPERAFYLEESFPLEWMYPHLSPSGQVMRLNRQPLAMLNPSVVDDDFRYWGERVQRFLGRKIEGTQSMEKFAAFIEQLYLRHQLPEKADRKFFENDWAQRAFSKWRDAIAGVYAWRAGRDQDASDRQRMGAAAEVAFRQAYAICPISPEAVHRYVKFLSENSRRGDALLLAETSARLAPGETLFRDMVAELRKAK